MKTFEIFSKEIGLNMQMLDNYITFADKYYNTYYISKKNKSKKRKIDSPSKGLKGIQRWVLKNYFNNLPVAKRANGFISGRGIKRNAKYHIDKQFLLMIDIKDFSPSISQKMVYEALAKHFEDRELTLKLSKLCTYTRKLPQGAPTSPLLSNIVFKEIDEQISSFCNTKLVVYSRYADDLVFSSETKNTLSEVYAFVNNIFSKYPFNINHSKTRYLSRKGAMKVTGININEGRLTVSKEIKRNMRSMFYNYIVKTDTTVNINSAVGYLSFIKDIEPDYYKKFLVYIDKLKHQNRKP